MWFHGLMRSIVAQTDAGFDWFSLVEPLGITTISLLICTLLVGLFIKKKRRVLLPLHRVLAFLTLAAGLCHAIIVLSLD